MVHQPSRWLVSLSLAVASACARGDKAATAPGDRRLILVDSVVLEESDTLYLGRPETTFLIDGAGDLLVADQLGGRVMRFDRSGRVRGTYGRPGDGPGEFRDMSPGSILSHGIYVQLASRKAHTFDAATGLYRSTIPTDFYLSDIVARNGEYLLTVSGTPGPFAVAVLPAARLFADHATQLEPLERTIVSTPEEYTRYPGLDIFVSSTLTAWADTLLVGFGGVPYLVAYTEAGTAIDTLVIPARSRRGHPRDASAVYATREFDTYEQRMSGISTLKRLWRTPDGAFILWFNDVTLTRIAGDFAFSARAYVTVLSTDRRRACVDIEIPCPGTEWPRIGLGGDTLYALDQYLATDGS